MHTRQYTDSEDIFRKTETKKYQCRKCKKTTATCRTWESSCGGYEDYEYTCQDPECKYRWWVDGPDS